MKEVTVKVTDKSDDANSSGGNGKVRYNLFFTTRYQTIILEET
jgi:hypothetical protein